MHLPDLTVAKVLRAVDLYLREAYRGADLPAPPDFLQNASPTTPISELFPSFLDESDPNQGAECYALRLGNLRYPFMKLRLQEYLYQGEFFFSVDTHDQMFADQSDPELARLKAFNRELRCRIEAAWEGAGIPTTAHLKGLTECRPVEREPKRGIRVLLVDDDPSIQDTIARMLEVKGFDVDRADDGEEALFMADPERHRLILMDVEMPRLTGIEACGELKADVNRQEIPVLLMTAGAVELARNATSPDGYLIKPFHADALFLFLEKMLGQTQPTEGEAEEAEA